MSTILPAYDEVAQFIGILSPQKLLEMKPSPKVQERLDCLLTKNLQGGLSADERAEMNQYLALENLIALAKAYARISIKQ